MANTKRNKQNFFESESENKATEFPRFIVIESLEETLLAKVFPFLIERMISIKMNLQTEKKLEVAIYLLK